MPPQAELRAGGSGQVLACVCVCAPNRVAACDIEYGEWRYTRTIVRRTCHGHALTFGAAAAGAAGRARALGHCYC